MSKTALQYLMNHKHMLALLWLDCILEIGVSNTPLLKPICLLSDGKRGLYVVHRSEHISIAFSVFTVVM
jgi:hypothetical protein